MNELTYGFSSATDLFAKLERDQESIHEEVTSDRFFYFVVTGYALVDWIRKDERNSSEVRIQAETLLNKDDLLKACRDLANASKHFKLTDSSKYPRVLSSATSKQGLGYGRLGKGVLGVGEKSIYIELSDGTTYNCSDFVDGVLEKWRIFFTQHSLLETNSCQQNVN